jgi:hypothetical protein
LLSKISNDFVWNLENGAKIAQNVLENGAFLLNFLLENGANCIII